MNHSKKALLIEDDFGFANMLTRRLTKHHYTCVHEAELNNALVTCKKAHPDVILLDMYLGDESGLELIQPLRALAPNARIVLLTGHASIATAVSAMRLGADHYLSKPIDTQTLLAALEDTPPDCDLPEEERPISPERLEWEHIHQVLDANNGNISATARALGMHRRTLQRKLQKKPHH